MKKNLIDVAISVLGAAIPFGCMDRQPAPVCPVPTELKSDEIQASAFDGVDLLVMVDDSSSMTEEQEILGTGFYTLVNSLAHPIPGWKYAAVESMRLAVVSSDMGVSVGEDAELPEEDPGIPNCAGAGDDGKFREYPAAESIAVLEDTIPCGEGAAQCPAGWSCEGIDAGGVGRCFAPGGDTAVSCPALGAAYAETTGALANGDFTAQVACLSQQGTGGCGFEQQLQSVAIALERDDQQGFLVDHHLLAVLLVTDEEDCSIADEQLYSEPEMGNIDGVSAINIACGENPNDLLSTEHFYDAFIRAKEDAGGAGAVIFAAITGVPWEAEDPAGAAACQGPGDAIGECLDQEAMALSEEKFTDADGTRWRYRPACERYRDGVAKPLTSAVPGRRYVELATDYFKANSYVYSICNPDWSDAMESVAALIAEQLCGTCYDKPLDWDAVNKVAKCNVVAQFTVESKNDPCPFDLAPGDAPTYEVTTTPSGETIEISCPLPKLESELSCGDNAETPSGFGWYYCENLDREDREDACADGRDDDGDGLTDCDDDECEPCAVACGGSGDGCDGDCKYDVSITDEARAALTGVAVTVQCLQQFSFEDGNCQEDSLAACTDGADNDGNGVYDCADVPGGAGAHLADPHCCPMARDESGACALGDEDGDGEADYQAICGGDGGWPDACVRASESLGCALP
jgi:hypothetical protein